MIKDMRLHKQTRSDTSSCYTHSCGFPILFNYKSYQNVLFHISNQQSVHKVVPVTQRVMPFRHETEAVQCEAADVVPCIKNLTWMINVS